MAASSIHTPASDKSVGDQASTGDDGARSGYLDEVPHRSLLQKFADSFRQSPTTVHTEKIGDGTHYDEAAAARGTEGIGLARDLKSRHLQMIAIGGSVGTGLFVGSGKALAEGGPASVLIAFSIVGILIFFTVQALGELAVTYPVSGSFSAYATRFIDPAWGFAMGWNYALQWLVILPLEITSATITINYWHSTIPKAVFVIIFWGLVIFINLFGVKGYGEAEFVFSIIKVLAVCAFIILGITIDLGGGPNGSYIGNKYWSDPGSFNNGFKGLCSVFVTAAFAYSGTELVGLAAAETENPRKSIPSAVKQVFWRILFFYVVSLSIIGLLIPYTDSRLLSGNSSADTAASPFVIAIEDAGISILPSVMNAVIMIAVISVGNSSVYGSSRTLVALAQQGQAPKIFRYIDRAGRPLPGVIVALLMGGLAFLAVANLEIEAFDWMLALSGLSSIFTWASVCLCHIRMRRAMKAKGRSTRELAFKAQTGEIGSYIGLTLNILVLIAAFWVSAFPINTTGHPLAAKDIAVGFFKEYLAVPVTLVFYLGFKLWYRTPIVKTKDIDLDTGRREADADTMWEQERAERQSWSPFRRVLKFFC